MKKSARFTKESLIKDIAKQTNNTMSDVRDIYNALENNIFNILSSVNENNDVCIKLFEGINLEGNYISKKEKKNNLTGKFSAVDSRIKPRFNITRSYCEKLNEALHS